MKYKLYPPFLVVPEEEDFSDVWESFCCKILCIEKSQNNIYRRNPPEQGVDVFDETDKVAYQCKCVESGKSGDFNVTLAVESLKSALKIKDELGWKTYILCTNVNISGSSEKKLKEVFPDIIIKSKDNWELFCEAHSDKVERNFNILVEIPSEKFMANIEEEFQENYAINLRNQLEEENFEIYLYTNRYEKIFKILVSPNFSINDLLDVIRNFLKLPESKKIESQDITVSLSHSIVFNKKKQPLSKTLKDCGISKGDVITYWTTILWEDNFKMRSDVMYHMTNEMTQKMSNKNERAKKAVDVFNKEIVMRFIQVENQLIQ